MRFCSHIDGCKFRLSFLAFSACKRFTSGPFHWFSDMGNSCLAVCMVLRSLLLEALSHGMLVLFENFDSQTRHLKGSFQFCIFRSFVNQQWAYSLSVLHLRHGNFPSAQPVRIWPYWSAELPAAAISFACTDFLFFQCEQSFPWCLDYIGKRSEAHLGLPKKYRLTAGKQFPFDSGRDSQPPFIYFLLWWEACRPFFY